MLIEDGLCPQYRIQPALRNDCVDLFDAFIVLSASRKWNQSGPQPIEVSEIDRYLSRMRLASDSDVWFRSVRHIQSLDEIERSHALKKQAPGKPSDTEQK